MPSIKSILALVFVFFITASLSAYAAEKHQPSHEELMRIQEELKGVKKKAKEATRQERSTLSDIERMDRSLSMKRAEVKRLEGRLSQVSRETAGTEAEIAGYRAKIKIKQADLAGRLRAMYKTERAGGPWAMLLASDDYGSTLKRYKYLSVVSKRDKRLIGGYTDDLEELSRQGERLRIQREDFDRLRRARDSEAARVEAEEAEKKKLLASIRQQKKSYLAMAGELEESGRRMRALIRKLEEETKSRPRSPMPALPAPSAGLEWPVSGKVITVFGRQKHPEYDTYIFRKGIEIQAAMGTEVRAAESAEVVFANWFKGLGLITILRHGGDLYSVYAHLSGLKVKMGERVSRGQVIATIGDTGAPSGPSLYFEVRKGSEAQDPLRWLRRK
jgi:septal ring factor EnvC (AmiA/AmiB activator)